MIDPRLAHKELVTNHRTMRWLNKTACVSVRKDNGRYTVRLEDYEYHKLTRKTFATLEGALDAANALKVYYL